MAVEEAELLRAVCATVHCPLPPLVAGAGAPAVHGEQDVAVPAGSAAGT
jgi:hypothetical protein